MNNLERSVNEKRSHFRDSWILAPICAGVLGIGFCINAYASYLPTMIKLEKGKDMQTIEREVSRYGKFISTVLKPGRKLAEYDFSRGFSYGVTKTGKISKLKRWGK